MNRRWKMSDEKSPQLDMWAATTLALLMASSELVVACSVRSMGQCTRVSFSFAPCTACAMHGDYGGAGEQDGRAACPASRVGEQLGRCNDRPGSRRWLAGVLACCDALAAGGAAPEPEPANMGYRWLITS